MARQWVLGRALLAPGRRFLLTPVLRHASRPRLFTSTRSANEALTISGTDVQSYADWHVKEDLLAQLLLKESLSDAFDLVQNTLRESTHGNQELADIKRRVSQQLGLEMLRSGDLDGLRRLVAEMEAADVPVTLELCNALLAFASSGMDGPLMEECLQIVRRNNVVLNEDSYTHIIGDIFRRGGPDAYSDIYRVLNEMRAKGVEANEVVCGFMVVLHGQRGETVAMQAWRQLQQKNFESMRFNNSVGTPPSLTHYYHDGMEVWLAMIGGFVKAGDMLSAERVYHQASFRNRGSQQAVAEVLRGYAWRGDEAGVDRWLAEATSRALLPEGSAVRDVLEGCALWYHEAAGKSVSGRERARVGSVAARRLHALAARFRDAGATLDADVQAYMVTAFSMFGDHESALDVWRNLQEDVQPRTVTSTVAAALLVAFSHRGDPVGAVDAMERYFEGGERRMDGVLYDALRAGCGQPIVAALNERFRPSSVDATIPLQDALAMAAPAPVQVYREVLEGLMARREDTQALEVFAQAKSLGLELSVDAWVLAMRALRRTATVDEMVHVIEAYAMPEIGAPDAVLSELVLKLCEMRCPDLAVECLAGFERAPPMAVEMAVVKCVERARDGADCAEKLIATMNEKRSFASLGSYYAKMTAAERRPTSRAEAVLEVADTVEEVDRARQGDPKRTCAPPSWALQSLAQQARNRARNLDVDPAVMKAQASASQAIKDMMKEAAVERRETRMFGPGYHTPPTIPTATAPVETAKTPPPPPRRRKKPMASYRLMLTQAVAKSRLTSGDAGATLEDIVDMCEERYDVPREFAKRARAALDKMVQEKVLVVEDGKYKFPTILLL